MALTIEEKHHILALATGREVPRSEFERHFLTVIRGVGRARGAKEDEWVTYWTNSKAEYAYPRLSEKHRIDRITTKKTTDKASHSRLVKASQISSISGSSSCDGYDRLLRELKIAISKTCKTNAGELADWGTNTVKFVLESGVRRIVNVPILVTRLTKASQKELTAAFWAYQSGDLPEHFGRRRDTLVDLCTETFQLAEKGLINFTEIVKNDPADGAITIASIVLGFYTGSGGFDADGGIPDLDLTFSGIGAHRSLITHSILAGIMLDTFVFVLLNLVARIHKNLPDDHHKLWNKMKAESEKLGNTFSRSANIGIGYHLFVDGTFQPAAYHDLPFSAPLWAHQSILVANAVMEGLDGAIKGESDYLSRIKGKITTGLNAARGATQRFIEMGRLVSELNRGVSD